MQNSKSWGPPIPCLDTTIPLEPLMRILKHALIWAIPCSKPASPSAGIALQYLPQSLWSWAWCPEESCLWRLALSKMAKGEEEIWKMDLSELEELHLWTESRFEEDTKGTSSGEDPKRSS